MVLRRPKIASNVLQRSRIQLWLEFHASTAVRYVYAPAGSGKTTSTVLYARNRPNAVAFITLGPGTDRGALLELFARELGLALPASYAELVKHLASRAPLEIVVDNVDHADADARSLLARIFRDVPDGVTFIYCARAQAAVPFGQARAQGLVDVCDPALLTFDIDESVGFATLLGVDADRNSIAGLHEATHGWAAAISSVCRFAAGNEMKITHALPYWLRSNGSLIDDLVTDALGSVEPEIATTFRAILAGRAACETELLEAFQNRGLFVTEWDGRPMLNPLLGVATCRPGSNDVFEQRVVPAVIEMFGRFEMTIGANPIVWIRRRDRGIVQYLAMQPRGRATRSQVIATFWPEADPQLAGQSLRTACSTIRRAIAACVGRANVHHYFAGGQMLELMLDTVSVSARAFSLQFDLAEAAYARNDIGAAFRQYRAAEVLYRAPFLAEEPRAAWAVAHEERFASMHRVAAARLDHLSASMRRRESGMWRSCEERLPVSA